MLKLFKVMLELLAVALFPLTITLRNYKSTKIIFD